MGLVGERASEGGNILVTEVEDPKKLFTGKKRKLYYYHDRFNGSRRALESSMHDRSYMKKIGS